MTNVSTRCAMCSKLLKKPTNVPLDHCSNCSATINRQQEQLRSKTVTLGLEIEAFEFWLLKRIARKRRQALSQLIREIWDQAGTSTILSNLGLMRFPPGTPGMTKHERRKAEWRIV